MAEESESHAGLKCIKYTLFITNFMFAMVGFLLISIGSSVKSIYEDFDLFMEAHYFSASNLAIAIGVMMFLISIFGCIGAIKESTCFTRLFALLLSVVLIVEVAAVIVAYSVRNDIWSTIRVRMEDSIQAYRTHRYEQEAWNFMQNRLHCCGISNYSDWQNVDEEDYYFRIDDRFIKTYKSMAPDLIVPMQLWGRNDKIAVPRSCCAFDTQIKSKNVCDGIWNVGCVDALSSLVTQCALLLACGGAAVAFIQFLGIIFANMLAKSIRRAKTQRLVELYRRHQLICEQLAHNNQDEKVEPVIYTNFVTGSSEA